MPDRVVGTVVCSGVGGTVADDGSEVAVGVALVMFIDSAGLGVVTDSYVVRVYTCCAPIDIFETPESFR